MNPRPTVAVADLHGHLQHFKRLLDRLDAELGDYDLVTLGDYVDNGPDVPGLLDFLIALKAERGDRWGNLTYRMAARNFGPVMATAAKRTVATVHELVDLGGLDPEAVVTPGIFVSRLVCIPREARA